jgi:ACS family allantoate permease-like MFS transporter
VTAKDKMNDHPKDKALDLLAHSHVAFDPNSAEAKRVLRKIDMRIMPMIFAIYLLQLMVRNICVFWRRTGSC